jgi:hypothetical protein
MKPIQYISLSLCMPLFFACNSHPAAVEHNADKDIIPVKVMELRKENSKTTMAVSGQFTTDDEVMLSFKTGGIISSLTQRKRR